MTQTSVILFLTFLAKGELHDHEGRIKKLENEIKVMSIMSGKGGDGVDASQLNRLIQMINELGENIRSEFDKKYLSIDGLRGINEATKDLQDSDKENKDDLSNIFLRLKGIENQMVELADEDQKLANE